MHRFRLVVEYDGTHYAGWQRQDNGASIQESLEDAVEALTGERKIVAGAGRTDAGVHALGQVAAFSTEKSLTVVAVLRGLNYYLPTSIAVVAVDEVGLDFDPRRDARGKLYRYRLWNADARSTVEQRTSWHLRAPLDLAAMRQAAARLVGKNDYAAFRAADCQRQNTVRHMRRIDVLQADPAVPLVSVEVEGDAFLKYMVRILVGTIVYVGRGRLSPDEVTTILGRRIRSHAGPTAPPHGLFLVHVDYELPLPPRA